MMEARIFRNANVHGVYKWCVRYSEDGWSKIEFFKRKTEAEEFVKTKENGVIEEA